MREKGDDPNMPGFFGYISDKEEILDRCINMYDVVDSSNQFLNKETIVNTGALYGQFFQNSIKKFENDKIFDQDQLNYYILDGVILNKKKLLMEHNFDEKESILTLVKKMTEGISETQFFNAFRGSFAGVFLNKHMSIFTLYTNHIGDKEVFYYLENKTNTLYFSTDFESLICMIRVHIGKKFKLNLNAAYCMLTHGHTLCNETLLEDIHRLTPGHYMQYSEGKILKKQYYTLDNTAISISEEEALEKIDSYFKNAVKMAFEKDLEYGYKHLVALSGGLDCRMTTWVAHEMGYTNVLNYTFSQSDYLDEIIPKQISSKLNNEWIFKSLDNGIYLYKYFEKAIRISGARSLSSTITHTLSMLDNLNLNNYGLTHTGQLGDVIIGTYYDHGKKQGFQSGAGANSKKMLSYVHYSKENAFHIEDQELFKFYNRGFTGVNIGLKPMSLYTETASPFTDIDFLDFCLSLPIKYRSGHSIYIKWINQYYPEAANFTYEKVNGKINKKIITIQGVPIPLTSIPYAVSKVIKKKLGLNLNSKKHMNPMDFWYKTNEELRNFYELQFKENINLVEDTQLKKNCQSLFRSGTTQEKDQVITLLKFLNEMKSCI